MTRIGRRPQRSDQAWFWTPEWQAGERQADREAAAGLGQTYSTNEEFLASLEVEQ